MISSASAPLVSILLPSYNHARYITEAVMSVVEQTYKSIELIVIDDGSTDGSAEILGNLSRAHGFRLEIQPNRGLIKTLERLHALATGEFISFFSSDDVYERTKLEKLVRFLTTNPEFAMVYSKIIQIDEHSREKQRIQESYKSGKIFRELLRGDFCINGLSALVRTEIVRKYRRFDTFIDDLPLWLQIARDHPIGFVDEFLAFYRVHSNHQTSNPDRMQKSEEEILERFRDSEFYPEAINAWNIRWFNALVERDRLAALRFFFTRVLGGANLLNSRVHLGLSKLLLPRRLLQILKRSTHLRALLKG
jgi:glycosyltransferase involved in cell wall biosynthesis